MQKTTAFILVSLVIVSIFMIYSLNYMKYLAEEEATVAYFGFPFAMRQTEPFSGGYFGDNVRAGGKEYVFRVNNIDSNSEAVWVSVFSSNALKTNWNGVVLNLITYTISSLVIFIMGEKLLRRIRIATG